MTKAQNAYFAGDVWGTISYLKKCISIKPDEPRYRIMAGQFYMETGYVEEAKRCYYEAVTPNMDKDDLTSVYIGLSIISMVDDDQDGAYYYAEKAIKSCGGIWPKKN